MYLGLVPSCTQTITRNPKTPCCLLTIPSSSHISPSRVSTSYILSRPQRHSCARFVLESRKITADQLPQVSHVL